MSNPARQSFVILLEGDSPRSDRFDVYLHMFTGWFEPLTEKNFIEFLQKPGLAIVPIPDYKNLDRPRPNSASAKALNSMRILGLPHASVTLPKL
jgi:hypothetical protein